MTREQRKQAEAIAKTLRGALKDPQALTGRLECGDADELVCARCDIKYAIDRVEVWADGKKEPDHD